MCGIGPINEAGCATSGGERDGMTELEGAVPEDWQEFVDVPTAASTLET